MDALLAQMDHLSPDAFNRLFGIEAPVLDKTDYSAPEQTRGQQVFQGLAGLENQPMPQPRGFGQSFVAGLTRGVGTAATRAAAQRAKLEADAQRRTQLRDQANQQATAQYRAARIAGKQALGTAVIQEGLAQGREGRADARTAAIREENRANTLTDREATNREWDRRFAQQQKAEASKAKTAGAKPPTEFQARAGFFGARANEASQNAIANGLEDRVLNKAWSLQAPPALQGDKDVRAYWRAMESFGLALNRLESGASIAPTEFSRVRQLYFVAPGDKAADIVAKRKLRESVVAELQKMQAQPAAPTAAEPPPPAAPMPLSDPASLWEPD